MRLYMTASFYMFLPEQQVLLETLGTDCQMLFVMCHLLAKISVDAELFLVYQFAELAFIKYVEGSKMRDTRCKNILLGINYTHPVTADAGKQSDLYRAVAEPGILGLFFSWHFFFLLQLETKALTARTNHKEDVAMTRASQFEPASAVSGRQIRGGMEERNRLQEKHFIIQVTHHLVTRMSFNSALKIICIIDLHTNIQHDFISTFE